MSQRQVVIAALDALSSLGYLDHEAFKRLVREVKRAHPLKGGRPRAK